MKKVILIVFALVLVATGLIGASAFEAHMVDVRAHVENALWVDPYEIDYGNVSLPEITYDEIVCVGLSKSFQDLNQTKFCDVYYAMFWEEKPIAGHLPVWPQTEICDPDGDGNFTEIWPYILVDPSPGDGLFPPSYPDTDWRFYAEQAGAFAWGTLNRINNQDLCDQWTLKFQAPAFEGFHNPTTDPKPGYGVIPIGEYCLVEEWVGCDDCPYRWVEVPHADLGNILKFQVWDYSLCPD
jgi:hypothetical protein